MDCLENKSTKTYDYISRYSNFNYYYNTVDNKYIYGITKQLDNTTDYVVHKIEISDNLDFLANKYYGRPDLYWIIADFNRIQDPFIKLSDYFKEIKIPSLTAIKFE